MRVADWLSQIAPWMTQPVSTGYPPAVKIGRATLTGADVRALYAVASHLVTRTANVQDAEVVADLVIDTALSAEGPLVAAIAAPAAEALAAAIIEGIASGRIRAAALPIAEAQTHEGRGGRRG